MMPHKTITKIGDHFSLRKAKKEKINTRRLMIVRMPPASMMELLNILMATEKIRATTTGLKLKRIFWTKGICR